MAFTLTRWTGDQNNPTVVQTQFNSIAEIIADVREKDGLSENEFYEFLLAGHFGRSDRGISLSENP